MNIVAAIFGKIEHLLINYFTKKSKEEKEREEEEKKREGRKERQKMIINVEWKEIVLNLIQLPTTI